MKVSFEEESKIEICPIVEAIKMVGSKWKLVIIRYLLDGSKGFNQLLRTTPHLNAKTLSRVLKELQREGIVERRVVSTQPFSVEYSLTDKGRDLKEVIEAFNNWGVKWILKEK